MMRWLIILPLLSSAPLVSRAEAATCEDSVRINLIPAAPTDAVPINARGILILADVVGPADLASWHVHLLAPDGSEVPLRPSAVSPAKLSARYIELRPQRPLEPERRYQVRVDGQAFDGSFVTGAAADTAPPRWDGIRGTRYVVDPAPEGAVRSYAELRVAPAQDDKTPLRSVVFAVWAAPADKSIDYARPPLAYVRSQSGIVRLGGVDACLTNLDISQGLHVGLRAVDLGGNRSRPSEAVIDLKHADPHGQ